MLRALPKEGDLKQRSAAGSSSRLLSGTQQLWYGGAGSNGALGARRESLRAERGGSVLLPRQPPAIPSPGLCGLQGTAPLFLGCLLFPWISPCCSGGNKAGAAGPDGFLQIEAKPRQGEPPPCAAMLLSGSELLPAKPCGPCVRAALRSGVAHSLLARMGFLINRWDFVGRAPQCFIVRV